MKRRACAVVLKSVVELMLTSRAAKTRIERNDFFQSNEAESGAVIV